MFGTNCHIDHYHCVVPPDTLTVTDSELEQCSANSFVVPSDWHCESTQSAVIEATPSAQISDWWQGHYHSGLFIITLSVLVLVMTLGGILGRLMFPKSL